MNKLERLLNLTAVLLATTRPLSAEELRRKVEGYPPAGAAFHRAFERDKDDLRVLGIPLRVERIAATDPPIDGYRIDGNDYYLPDPGLAPDELAALHLASLTVRLEGDQDREALWKLGGLGGPDAPAPSVPGANRTRIDGAVTSIPTDPALEPLFKAIAERQAVRFGYRNRSGTVDERLVEPWRLDFQRGRWYLTGWDRVREDQRNFRLDRIDGTVTQTGDQVTTEQPVGSRGGPLPAWELGDEPPVRARLLVDAERVESVARQLGGSPDGESALEWEPGPDGSRIFTVSVVRYDAFRTFVLGLLDHAELLEPPEWRRDLVAWLEGIAHPVSGRTGGAAG